jgi:hypothetical protein
MGGKGALWSHRAERTCETAAAILSSAPPVELQIKYPPRASKKETPLPGLRQRELSNNLAVLLTCLLTAALLTALAGLLVRLLLLLAGLLLPTAALLPTLAALLVLLIFWSDMKSAPYVTHNNV